MFDVASTKLSTQTVRSALEDAICQQPFPGLSRGRAALARAVMVAVLESSMLGVLPVAQQAQQGSPQLELMACFCTVAENRLESMLRAAQYRDACREYYDHWRDMVWFHQRHSELHAFVEYEKVLAPSWQPLPGGQELQR